MLRALSRDEAEVRTARRNALVEKARKMLAGTLILRRHKGKLFRKFEPPETKTRPAPPNEFPVPLERHRKQ